MSSLQCVMDPFQGMLLQSGAGLVDVFPSVPTSWGEVVIHKLRAEGAFLVSGRFRQGRAQFVAVKSLVGAKLMIRPRVPGPVDVIPSTVKLVPVDNTNEVFVADGLLTGQTILIYQSGKEHEEGQFKISPAPSKFAHRNFWGKH